MKAVAKIIGFISIALMFSSNIKAQYITLPDPTFANFIAATYPSAVNASKQLDTNIAKTIPGSFTCKWKGINDVYGLQYFHNLTTINLTGNNLSTIPDLSKITNLTFLYIDSNKITNIPSLSSLTNLQKFNCRKNKLTTLPSLSGKINLVQFFCDNNLLTTFPDLTGCTSLNHVICSDNKITFLPDLSSLVSLKRLLLTNNLLTNVDLTMLPALEEVHLRYNRLTSFPKITGMVQLTELWLQDNSIDSIPDLSSYINLTNFKIHLNNLTFEDLTPLTSHSNFSSFQIAPQNQVGMTDTIRVRTGDSVIITTPIDTSLSTTAYSWYKDGVFQYSNSTGVFTIDSAVISDNASIYYTITNSNPILSAITLTSKPIQLIVVSCFDASQIEISIQTGECRQPFPISIDQTTIYGGQPPFTYTLTNIVSGQSSIYTDSSFTLPHEGNYDLQIKDNNGCIVLLHNKIQIARNDNCEAIFYPDMEGLVSAYYIENPGTARIYNKEGDLIKQLTTPAFWDGTNKNGESMPTGVYMIIVNEQLKIQVSLMRTH